MKDILKYTGAIALGALLTYLLVQTTTEKAQDRNYEKHVSENYKVFSLAVPEGLTFCGEEIPLHKMNVAEKLDRELLVNTYWHSNTFLMMKRANRYFPVIEKILAEEQMPDDLKYLALIESGLTTATSPAGAKGFWQFMSATGKSYGLEVNSNVDERNHIEKATRAACNYLKDSYDQFGDWGLVAASYNMGSGGVRKKLKQQKQETYWDLELNSETSRYVYRILAVKEILNNAGKYGFRVRPKDLYPPYQFDTVAVDTAITDLVAFANKYGMSYHEFKTLNPWLRKDNLENRSGKQYSIKVSQK
ncbi:MAG: lytic transglycosylase domain-containing protein [Flavobacteriales bacterium]